MSLYSIYEAKQKTSSQKNIGTISDEDTSVLTRVKPTLKRPSLYQVILLNDAYTPMDFVVYILERFFSKSSEEAVQIMLNVHCNGSGVAGLFTYEIAEAKCDTVRRLAAKDGHPLECIIRKE